jgi:HD-like signal output (HDOD) protein
MTQDLREQTIERITVAMQSGQSPCLPELVQIIHALSSKATDISVSDLADLVEKHVAVMAKVIAAANSFGYNPTGLEIATVRQAIQVIGFDRIRTLVTSLVLVRHAVNQQESAEQRNTAILALCSGLVAQALADDRALADPEQAFVAASLRHLGKLLITSYLYRDFKTITALSAKMPEREAYLQILGITPLALAHEILSRANLPPVILGTLHEYRSSSTHAESGESATLLALADLSEKLCALALDKQTLGPDFAAKAHQLAQRYDLRLRLTHNDVGTVIGAMGERLAEFTHSLGCSGFAKDFVATLRWRTQGKPLPASGPIKPANTQNNPRDGEVLPSDDEYDPLDTQQLSQEPSTGDVVDIKVRHWRDGLVSLSSSLDEPEIDMNVLFSQALNCVREGFGATESVLLTVDKDQRSFIATQGTGQVFRQIRGDRAVRRDEKNVLGVCMSRRENVVIHDTSDVKIAPYLPPWCSPGEGWSSFVAIPIYEQTYCFALLLVGWSEPRHINLTPEQTKILRSLLSVLAAARRLTSA